MATPHKLLFIFGTRPEAIKLAPVIKEAARDSAFRVETCVTAQHRDMLDQVLRIFSIQPDYDLDIMQDNQSPTQVASAVLARLALTCAPATTAPEGSLTTPEILPIGACPKSRKGVMTAASVALRRCLEFMMMPRFTS